MVFCFRESPPECNRLTEGKSDLAAPRLAGLVLQLGIVVVAGSGSVNRMFCHGFIWVEVLAS